MKNDEYTGTNIRFSLPQLHYLAVKALQHHNTGKNNAEFVAAALVSAEADGLSGHGLSRLPSYCAQSASGKVNGHAVPTEHRVAKAAVRVDANHGFAFPALALAVERLAEITPDTGVAVASITRSHHCGVAGYHVEALARKGLIGFILSNTPAAIAPRGGTRGVFGTNPIAFATPRKDGDPLVIDLSLSKIARGKIMVARQQGQTIPYGWALDPGGQPTTDPEDALAGTMLPMGEAKGAVLALMVEILSAALTASHFGFEASSFFTPDGDPPGIGHLFIAFNPDPLSDDHYFSRLEVLLKEILAQENTRLPGERRLKYRRQAQQYGLDLSRQQFEQLQQLIPGITVEKIQRLGQ